MTRIRKGIGGTALAAFMLLAAQNAAARDAHMNMCHEELKACLFDAGDIFSECLELGGHNNLTVTPHEICQAKGYQSQACHQTRQAQRARRNCKSVFRETKGACQALFHTCHVANFTADADLIVDDDGAQCPKADYTNLQDGVDAAQPGDTIFVCPGSYVGTITIPADKAGLTLRGMRRQPADRIGDPSREAVLDGSPDGTPGFQIQADHAAIIGFTILDTGDSGIEVKPADDVTPIYGARIEWNRLDTVGDPDVDGTDCAGGRGINFEVATAVIAKNNYITNSCGAGVRLKSATDGLLKHNVIDRSRKRPGIAVRGGDNHRIIANTSLHNREAGISLHDSTDNVVQKNRMKGNGAPGDPLRPIPGQGSNTDADDTTNLPLENPPNNTWEGNHCITENRDGLCEFTRMR